MRKPLKFDQNVFDLTKWVPMLGKEAAFRFTRTMIEHPDFANAILKYYTTDDLRVLAKKADEERQAYRIRVRRAYALAAEMQRKAMIG